MSNKLKALLGGLGAVLLICLAIFFSVPDDKVDLLGNLQQEEANHMVALLLINHIEAEKSSAQTGAALTLRVPKRSFVRAVELLRQNGYPRKVYATVGDIFPSNQLISSPGQENAKFNYLKGEQLASLLSCFDGVIEVRVIIAEGASGTSVIDAAPIRSASVIIKHSSEGNLQKNLTQIKSLVKNSIPGLDYDHLTVVLHGTEYRGADLSHDSGLDAS